MSGWIKLEKDLREDVRVKRMARELVPRCNACALHAVTLVLGGLVQLWMHADTFARDDDTLEITAAEIDELTGIEGFAELIPQDWLEVLDATRVKLPDFQKHNGSEAKRKAQTAKRVSKHRALHSNGVALRETNTCNAQALPDQTRPDQIRPDQKKTRTAAAPPRAELAELGWFDEFKSAYPRRGGDQGWSRALRAAHARIAEGHAPAEFLEGAKRYAEYCAATQNIGTQFVKQASSFLGPDKPFLQPWIAPASRAEVRLNGNLSAAAEFLKRTDKP